MIWLCIFLWTLGAILLILSVTPTKRTKLTDFTTVTGWLIFMAGWLLFPW